VFRRRPKGFEPSLDEATAGNMSDTLPKALEEKCGIHTILILATGPDFLLLERACGRSRKSRGARHHGSPDLVRVGTDSAHPPSPEAMAGHGKPASSVDAVRVPHGRRESAGGLSTGHDSFAGVACVGTDGREYEQGTNQNKLRDQDISKIVDTFLKRKVIDKYSHLAAFAEIEENDFNLNLPRYIDTFEPDPEVDIVAVQKDIERIEGELTETQAKMRNYLKELGFDK
jgi:hypothetical protein